MTNPRILHWSVRPTTQDEINSNMPYLTASMVEAVTTCPKWGIIHNVQHKRFVTGYRQMALEAGSLMHDVFGGFNLLHVAASQDRPDHAWHHGCALMGKDRITAINFKTAVEKYKTNPARAMDSLAYSIIGTSEYYDDPNDKNRTLANLEHAAVELTGHYLSTLAAYTILVTDHDDPSKPIGVEQSLDVVFYIHFDDGSTKSIRFIGLADVVYQRRSDGKVSLGEYKTTSSMGDGWREAFKTRHQLSAYIGALHAYFDDVAYDVVLTGSALPVRKTSAPNITFPVDRDAQAVTNFLTTALFATSLVTEWPGQQAVYAPMFTHSCNRYFRPCALLDLCSSVHDDQEIMWEQMTIDADMSPSELKAMLRKEN